MELDDACRVRGSKRGRPEGALLESLPECRRNGIRAFRLWHGSIAPNAFAMFSTDPLESAAEGSASCYARCGGPCIRRMRCGRAFRYVGPDGKPVRDSRQLARIRSLVIPPAWSRVSICPSPNGHLQAVGVDARGRKQYRYHPRYREVRDQAKFSRMIAFGAVLARIRCQVSAICKRPGLPKQKVLAAVVRLFRDQLHSRR